MAEQHTILGGKVYVYKRPNSSRWQCSSFFASKNRRTSTKEESVAKAKDVAEDWYLQLRGKLLTGELKAEMTFREVSEQFLRECEIMTRGERSKQYVKASICGRAFTWCPSSETWTSRRSPREKSSNIEFTDINKQSRNTASRRHTAPCTRNRDAAPDPEDRAVPRMARPASRFL
jgi:hypothetical protein